LAERGIAFSEVVCKLETGRTHQIRVHLASQKHPLLGDDLYGGKTMLGAERQMLHARGLGFEDPATGQLVQFESALPDDMNAVRECIEWKNP
jgi:23S rRNA pseudouridine1911/1915/1917 synthase